MSKLLIRCDASQMNGVSYGAYAIGARPPTAIELSGDLSGIQSEIELICEIIDHFRVKHLVIHHDVAQMRCILRRSSFSTARRLAGLLNENRNVDLLYVPRKFRHVQYHRCHNAARAAVERHLRKQQPVLGVRG